MNKLKMIMLGFAIVIINSCGIKEGKISPSTYSEYQKRGDEVASIAQATLLANVGMAIQKRGTVYAVEFCNLNASLIVDSLNNANDCIISRVSEKNRNAKNAPEDESEKEVIKIMSKGDKNDTLIQNNSTLTYYKSIRTGLAACLKCHGNPDSDIDTETLQKIRKLYPDDLATGYQLNDFRGLWKVEFSQ